MLDNVLGSRPYAPSESVVAVELTIDGMLVIADLLQLAEFPTVLGIRPNIPDENVRDIVWDQVRRDLTEQAVLDAFGQPQPTVAAMVDTIARADRTFECRWWRRDIGGAMVRFAICRKGDQHVIVVRDDDLLVLQLVSPQIGLAKILTAVVGESPAADVEPLTGIADELAACATAEQLASRGISHTSAQTYTSIVSDPSSWIEITASQRHPGGTSTHTEVAAGVLDSERGRLVSLPRQLYGHLYGSFLPGTPENLQLALDALLGFLPAGSWLDHADTDY